MNPTNPDYNQTSPGRIQTNPDYNQTSPDGSSLNPTKSGPVQTSPDKDETGADDAQIGPETIFPSPPYEKNIDDAFVLFSKNGLVEKRRTVTRWAKRGLFDAKQDPHDRNKWWLTEKSMYKKFSADMKRKRDRINRKNTLINNTVRSSGEEQEVLDHHFVKEDLDTKKFSSSDSERDPLKKELAGAKIARRRAEENLEGMDRAAVNIGFGFSQNMQLVLKEKILLEEELKKALPPIEFSEVRSKIDSEVEQELKRLDIRTNKKLELGS